MEKIELACIIEDDPMHLFLTKKFMELTGLVEKILVFKNGKDAYDALEILFINNEKLPQIIFLDLNMPVWDGWKFLEEFTKMPITQKINIYILTSSVYEEDTKQAERYNLTSNYLEKPISQEQMKTILSELISS